MEQPVTDTQDRDGCASFQGFFFSGQRYLDPSLWGDILIATDHIVLNSTLTIPKARISKLLVINSNEIHIEYKDTEKSKNILIVTRSSVPGSYPLEACLKSFGYDFSTLSETEAVRFSIISGGMGVGISAVLLPQGVLPSAYQKLQRRGGQNIVQVLIIIVILIVLILIGITCFLFITQTQNQSVDAQQEQLQDELNSLPH